MNPFAYVAAGALCVAGCNTVADLTGVAISPDKNRETPLLRQRLPILRWHAEPPRAVVGPQRTILAGQQACLDDGLSYHPMAIPYITSWTQVAGEPVTLDARDCFVAPEAGWTLGFTLSADDAAMCTHATLLLHVVTSSALLAF